MANIIRLPSKEYILRCHKCKINTFYIILNSENWTDLKGFECAECGNYTEIQPNKSPQPTTNSRAEVDTGSNGI